MSVKKWFFIFLLFLAFASAGAVVLYNNPGIQSEASLSVVTFNVGTLDSTQPRMVKVSEILSENGIPDILLLQEVPDKNWLDSVAGALEYSYQAFGPYKTESGGGLAVLSRYPVNFLKVFHLNIYAAMAAECLIGNKKTLLLCVHLERIEGVQISNGMIKMSLNEALSLLKKELTQETDRTRAVKELLSWIESQSYSHVIVAGDFNTVPFSKTIREVNLRYEDALWPSLSYFHGTYNESPLPIQPRIDYIFHSPDLKCTDAGIIGESAGDHYPVWAIFDPQISQIRSDYEKR